MTRTASMLALTLAVGMVLGAFGGRILNAQQEPVKRTTLLKDDLAGIEGKEAHIRITEIAPGATSPKHYHPGHVFGYVLEGSLLFEAEGLPPVTRAAGEAFHEPPKQVHSAKNASQTIPVRILAFAIVEKGQPDTIPVR
jgi:quercetin dioxygenase-like cupin family protein